MQVKVKNNKLDYVLLNRLLELNPGIELPALEPDIYQSKEWLTMPDQNQSIASQVESRAIIEQLVSRFIIEGGSLNSSEMVRYNLNTILVYIQDHIAETISIDFLANMACLSKDHFIRIFKKILNIPPGEFIITKRIEKAKLLLITTDKPIKRIIEEVGFKSEAYFSRIFKKHTSYSPSDYRRNQTI
ncbi:AraC family transcriptional regulator [Prolixibacteraceae bacterium JC049]|nr:AraC family transcriptional regulator [Prolixibacteraceae bacterium JC049]